MCCRCFLRNFSFGLNQFQSDMFNLKITNMKTKIFLFVCLFTGAVMLFSGCSEDNSLIPSQNDELSLKSKKIPTHFVGTYTPLCLEDLIHGMMLQMMKELPDFHYGFLLKQCKLMKSPTEISGRAEIFVGAEDLMM